MPKRQQQASHKTGSLEDSRTTKPGHHGASMAEDGFTPDMPVPDAPRQLRIRCRSRH
jgi:hypothetical protein